MTRIIAVIMAVLMAFTPAVALAQQTQTYTRFRMPAGTACVVNTERFQCFNLGEYTALLTMDEDLRVLTGQHAAELAQIDALTHASDELQLSLTAANDQITTLQAERTRLTQLWQNTDEQLRQAQNQPDWSWIPWTLAAAFAITTLVLGLIVGLEHR